MTDPTESRWEKKGYFWLRKGPKPTDGISDFIFNNLTKILDDEDDSEWAVHSFIACSGLLIQKKRWPKDLTPEGAAPNRYIYYIFKFLRIKKYSFRSRDDMTRDPYVAFDAVYQFLVGKNEGKYDEILKIIYESVKWPRYLYRPEHWGRHKKLIEDDREFYLKRLDYLQAKAEVIHFERTNAIWHKN